MIEFSGEVNCTIIFWLKSNILWILGMVSRSIYIFMKLILSPILQHINNDLKKSYIFLFLSSIEGNLMGLFVDDLIFQGSKILLHSSKHSWVRVAIKNMSSGLWLLGSKFNCTTSWMCDYWRKALNHSIPHFPNL